MTVNKRWFIKLDKSIKKVIGYADGIYVTSERKGNIVVFQKDGQKATITDILYVHSMTSTLIRICQLLSKIYSMKVEENQMKVYNGEGRLILKAPLADNETF